MPNGLSALMLGTAQFGGQYGVTNLTGCPSDEELGAILTTAAKAGVSWLDTARVYGNAEKRLGRLLAGGAWSRWSVVSKIAPLKKYQAEQDCKAADAALHSLDESLAALATDHIAIMMLHRAEDATAEVMSALDSACSDGRVGALGVSVYTLDQAISALAEERIKHIQIPFHPLDWRWVDNRFQQALERRPDVAIHARSAFLQGLLLNNAERWPSWVDAAPIVDELECLAADLGGGRVELCLRFHRGFDWIGRSVVGVESTSQMRDIIDGWSEAPLPDETFRHLKSLASTVPERLLDPARW